MPKRCKENASVADQKRWAEPALALLRKKRKGEWTEKHRNVARKLLLEGGWVQRRLFDFGWTDMSQCQACQMEEGTEKQRLFHCPEWYEVRREIPKPFRNWEQKAKTSKKEWKWQRGLVTHPFRESQWNGDHFQCDKVGVREAQQLGMPAEGSKGHVATDGSLLGTAGKWGQWCSWIMMKNWGPCTGYTARWKQTFRSSALSRGWS